MSKSKIICNINELCAALHITPGVNLYRCRKAKLLNLYEKLVYRYAYLFTQIHERSDSDRSYKDVLYEEFDCGKKE